MLANQLVMITNAEGNPALNQFCSMHVSVFMGAYPM